MKLLKKIYTAVIFVFLYAPIAIMILFSFNEAKSLSVFTGFSLKWYRELFRNGEAMQTLYNTVILALLAMVISTVIGTLAAVGIERMRSRYLRRAITSVSNIPMMNPDIVTGISMALLFAFAMGLLRIEAILGFWTVLIAHVTFCLPYVILSVTPKLRQMNKHLPEAALDLGCTPVQSFFKVELPNIMPGVISGAIMAFTLSLDDFVISYFTTSGEFQTLPIYIYSMTKRAVTPDMYSLSTIIFAVVLLLLIITNIAQGRSDSKVRKSQRSASRGR